MPRFLGLAAAACAARAARLIAVAIALAAFGVSPTHAQTGTSACRGPDSTSAAFVAAVRRYMGTSEAPIAAARAGIGLVNIDPAQVTLVTDTRVCQKAARAYAAKVSGTGSGLTNRVYVVKAGPRYVVLDPGYHYHPTVGMWLYMVLTDKFAWVSMFG